MIHLTEHLVFQMDIPSRTHDKSQKFSLFATFAGRRSWTENLK